MSKNEGNGAADLLCRHPPRILVGCGQDDKSMGGDSRAVSGRS